MCIIIATLPCVQYLVAAISRHFSEMSSPGCSVYVGNMPYQATEDSIGTLFSQAGRVNNVKIVYDHDTGRAKGFGFVDFADRQGAQNAVETLNGVDFHGRALRVNMSTRN